MPSFKKYFAKKTIIVTTVVETSDIPAPAISLRTDRKNADYNPPLTVEQFYEGHDNFSYRFEEIVLQDNSGQKWGKHLDLIGKNNVIFMVTPNKELTANAHTSLSLEFAENYSMAFGESGINGFNFPDCALYDPRFDLMSPNLLSVPYEFVNYLHFMMTASKAVIYLEVRYK